MGLQRVRHSWTARNIIYFIYEQTYSLHVIVLLLFLEIFNTNHIPLCTGHVASVCVYEAKSLQSCPTLCSPVGCSPSGSSVHEILLARILDWVAMPSSRGSSWPRDQTGISRISYIGRWVLYQWCHLGNWHLCVPLSNLPQPLSPGSPSPDMDLCSITSNLPIPSPSCDPHTRLRSPQCLSARGLSVPFIIPGRSTVPPFGTCLVSMSWPLLPDPVPTECFPEPQTLVHFKLFEHKEYWSGSIRECCIFKVLDYLDKKWNRINSSTA